MTRSLTALALLVLAPIALAHPGHDHAATAGGAWHHLLWLALPVAAVATAYAFRKPIRQAIQNRKA